MSDRRGWQGQAGDSAQGCEEMEAGAEYLAAISTSADQRIEHLKMAGHYRLRAQRAGGRPRSATAH